MPEIRTSKEPGQLDDLTPEMRVEVEQGLAKEAPPENPEPPKEPNVMIIVAQFCRLYPGEFQNGNIGWRLFWGLWAKRESAQAFDRNSQTHAFMLGSGMFSGDTIGYEREKDRKRATVFD
jgi:hypothetical protein